MIASDAAGEPRHPAVARHLPSRVRLTPLDSEGDTVLWAIGRTRNDIVVEVERGDEVIATRPLAGFFTHAPGLFDTISPDVLRDVRADLGLD